MVPAWRRGACLLCSSRGQGRAWRALPISSGKKLQRMGPWSPHLCAPRVLLCMGHLPSFLGLPRTNHGGPENILDRKGQTWSIVAPSASGSGVMGMEHTTGSRQRGLPLHPAVQISPSAALVQVSRQLVWWFMTSGRDEDGRQEEGQWRGSW